MSILHHNMSFPICFIHIKFKKKLYKYLGTPSLGLLINFLLLTHISLLDFLWLFDIKIEVFLFSHRCYTQRSDTNISKGIHFTFPGVCYFFNCLFECGVLLISYSIPRNHKVSCVYVLQYHILGRKPYLCKAEYLIVSLIYIVFKFFW